MNFGASFTEPLSLESSLCVVGPVSTASQDALEDVMQSSRSKCLPSFWVTGMKGDGARRAAC